MKIRKTIIMAKKQFLAIFCVGFLVALPLKAVVASDVPYYASIRSNEANVRTGPSVKYPIRWVYQRSNWPIKVDAVFSSWRKISDINGELGWMHESLLSRNRFTLVNSEGVQEVYRLPVLTASVVMLVEKGVIAELLECKESWCHVKIDSMKGWIRSEYLWGIS